MDVGLIFWMVIAVGFVASIGVKYRQDRSDQGQVHWRSLQAWGKSAQRLD